MNYPVILSSKRFLMISIETFYFLHCKHIDIFLFSVKLLVESRNMNDTRLGEYLPIILHYSLNTLITSRCQPKCWRSWFLQVITNFCIWYKKVKRINFLDKFSFKNEIVFAVLLSTKRKRFVHECSIHINEKIFHNSEESNYTDFRITNEMN